MLACFFCPNTNKHMKLNALKWWWQIKDQQIDAEEVADKKIKQVATWKDDWVAEPEHGVVITLVPRTARSNYLRKIRFRENVFGHVLEAQKWWSDNYDRLIDLYSLCQPPSPYQSDNDEDESNSIQAYKPSPSTNSNDHCIAIEANYDNSIAAENNSMTTCLKGVKGKVVKWVVEDEPGVYVTIHSLPNDAKEIVRVELSQERFGEVNARVWWDENKGRLLEQYL